MACKTWVWSLDQEDPLEKGMATHSSILAWRITWTEEPGGLQFMGSQRVGHDRVTKHTCQYSKYKCFNSFIFRTIFCKYYYQIYLTDEKTTAWDWTKLQIYTVFKWHNRDLNLEKPVLCLMLNRLPRIFYHPFPSQSKPIWLPLQ